MENNLNWKNLKKKLLENKDFEKEYKKYDLAFEIGEMVTDARVKLGLTQAQLASLAETQQPSIARLENGSTLPSLTFLDNLAKSMDTYLIAPKFAFLDTHGVVEIRENVADLVKWNIAGTIPQATWIGFGGTINPVPSGAHIMAASSNEHYEHYLRLCTNITTHSSLKLTEEKEKKSEEIKVEAPELQHAYA